MRGRTNVTAATSVFAVVKKNTNNQQKKDGRVRKEGEGGWLWKAVSRGMRQSRLLRERITERRKKKGVNNKRWREPHSSTPSPAATFFFSFHIRGENRYKYNFVGYGKEFYRRPCRFSTNCVTMDTLHQHRVEISANRPTWQLPPTVSISRQWLLQSQHTETV